MGVSDLVNVTSLVALIEKIQGFDTKSLVQVERHGELAFHEAIQPARRLVDLFRLLPVSVVESLPFSHQKQLETQSRSILDLFQQILDFKVSVSDAAGVKQSILSSLVDAYQPTFDRLYLLIAYATAVMTDFAGLEERARASIHSIDEQRKGLLEDIQKTAEQAEKALEEARNFAAETGVSSEARHFAEEAKRHKSSAFWWLIATVVLALLLLAHSILSFLFYRWLSPQGVYEFSQLLASKFLVFAVLAYLLIQSAKNYMAQKHNEVVNKHRQNSLQTYRTLVEAGNSLSSRDLILAHAASAIYSPVDTGYGRGGDTGSGYIGSIMPLIERGVAQNTSP